LPLHVRDLLGLSRQVLTGQAQPLTAACHPAGIGAQHFNCRRKESGGLRLEQVKCSKGSGKESRD
jgi:hypothetical protein